MREAAPRTGNGRARRRTRAKGLAIAAVWVASLVFLAPSPAQADRTVIAVASNFHDAMERLVPLFEAQAGKRLTVAYGSTGKLYAQIVSGAPFDAFLSADAERPRRLVDEGHAVAGSRFTYAFGRLVLWHPAALDDTPLDARRLEHPAIRRVAMANPDLAPYGLAAQEVLAALALSESVAGKIVLGENIGQAFALVATGNAQAGFVAAAQLAMRPAPDGDRRWPVPSRLHAPIRQDAVLLQRAGKASAAPAFLAFLASEPAAVVLSEFGYGVD